MADEVAALLKRVAHLTPVQRRKFIAKLVVAHETEVQDACGSFFKCDACGKMVSEVTSECQAYDDNLEDCCDDCVVHCVCGADYAPSGDYFHESCHMYTLRCFCGKTIDLEANETKHGPQCDRAAKVKFQIEGEMTQEIAAILIACEMVKDGNGWISTKAYTVDTTCSVEEMACEFPKSIFHCLWENSLAQFGLELDEFKGEFTDEDGAVETTSFDLDSRFQVPDPDSAEVYTGLSFCAVMKVVPRVTKKRKTVADYFISQHTPS